jgi:hypothetical protein
MLASSEECRKSQSLIASQARRGAFAERAAAPDSAVALMVPLAGLIFSGGLSELSG